MYRSLLVPLDGSTPAESVLPYAEGLAHLSGARLILLQVPAPAVVDHTHQVADEAGAVSASTTYLGRISTHLNARGIDVETSIAEGDVAGAIVRSAERLGVDAIAMATHGRSGLGRWLYGSVAEEVLRRAGVPVFLVPAACSYAWPVDPTMPASKPRRRLRVLVPLDGSSLGEAALSPAGQLASSIDGGVLLLRVVELPTYPYGPAYAAFIFDPEPEIAEAERYLDHVAGELRQGQTVASITAVGQPATAIATVAREQSADVIAMATHGRTGLARITLGSVTVAVLQQAALPLLLVRPTGLREED
jgi:nucleotide-binding universal stress UspA family protein